MQSPQGGTFGGTYGELATGYAYPPLKRHKTTLAGSLSISAYQAPQRSTQGTSSQGDLYQHYPSREALRSNRSSFYSSEPQSGSAYPADFSFGQPRLEPFAATSSAVPQGSGWLGGFSQQQYGRPSGLQYPYQEPLAQFGLGQVTTPQSRQTASYTQPVPPERRLPSSTPNQFEYARTHGQIQRQDSFMPETSQLQSYDHPRSSYPLLRTQQSAQDTYSQLPSRTLPPPSQYPALLPSLGSSSGAPGSSTYPPPTTQQGSDAPTASNNYTSGTPSYRYSQHQGQQGYR